MYTVTQTCEVVSNQLMHTWGKRSLSLPLGHLLHSRCVLQGIFRRARSRYLNKLEAMSSQAGGRTLGFDLPRVFIGPLHQPILLNIHYKQPGWGRNALLTFQRVTIVLW